MSHHRERLGVIAVLSALEETRAEHCHRWAALGKEISN